MRRIAVVTAFALLLAGRAFAQNQPPGELGVEVKDAPGSDPSRRGAEITSVRSGMPAEKAGLKVGDVIATVDGTAVPSRDLLRAEMARHPAGATVRVAIRREGRDLTIPIPLASWADVPFVALDAGGHTSMVAKVLFTPDGRELITVSPDKTIRIWDVASGEPTRTLWSPAGLGLMGGLGAATLSPDGRTLAVGGAGDFHGDFPIDLIDLVSGRLLRVLRGHTNTITALSFSADGSRLASGSFDHTARIWDLASGRCVHNLAGHGDVIFGVAFAPDGRRLATASYDKTGRIWSAQDGRELAILRGHSAEVHCVAWRPDGQAVATGGYDRTIHQWSPEGAPLRTIDGLDDLVTSLAFSADSRRLLATWGGSGSGKDGAGVFDVPDSRPLSRFGGHTNTVQAGAFSPDGVMAATAGGNNQEVFLWRTSDGSVVHRMVGRGRGCCSAAWGRDGRSIAWGSTGKMVSDNDRGPLEFTFRPADLTSSRDPGEAPHRAVTTIGTLALSRPGPSAIAVKRGEATVATLAPAFSRERFFAHTLLPGARAAIGGDYGLYLFDALTGKLTRTFVGHTSGVWAVAPSPDGRYLLSASSDQTLRIWDLNRDEPLLSLFVAGDDWVAWTPEGYYAASPGGERLMGWHLGNGTEAMADFRPAADFHKVFYRPEVIKVLLEAGSVARALEVVGERDRVALSDALPPAVFITSPDAGGVTLKSDELEVKAVARGQGGRPVTAMRLLVDGRPYDGQQGRKDIAPGRFGAAQAGDVRESWTVRLSPGVHRLAVQAESAVSKATSDEVQVNYEAPRVVKPTLYVLAVGISEYPGALRLNYAAKDARDLEGSLRGGGARLFGRVETNLLTDRKATRRDIIAGLSWLRKRMTDADVGVVFYSGHGALDDDGNFFLVPQDVDPADLAGSGVHGAQLKASLAGLKGRIIVLLDACHAGAAEGGGRRKGLPKGLTDDLARELSSEDYGVIVMCSSTGREVSIESDAIGQGYFTKALVEGLSGRADFNKDGLVYVTELDTFVSDRVRELSKDGQHPVTAKPASVRPFAIARP